jgi:hypothetical protein
LQKRITMSNKTTNTTAFWFLFLLSTICLLAAIYFKWPYLTMIIPFVTTFFVKALRII